MKTFLFLCLLSYTTIILAQDYQISFGIQGLEETPDSVTVCNQDQNTCLDLLGSDVLHLVREFVGIPENDVSNLSINVYPNPITDRASIEFYNPDVGVVRVLLSDIRGKLMEVQSYDLPKDFNALEISGLAGGTYVLRVQGESFYYTTLLISSGSSNMQSENFLSPGQVHGKQNVNGSPFPEDIQLKSEYTNQEVIQMQYNDGEQLIFKAYMNTNQAEVILIPAGSQVVDFNFTPVLLSTVPELGYAPVLSVDGSVILVFDKAVLYDETKDLTFTEFYDGEDVVAGSVTVDSNEVTVTFGEKLTNADYVMLSYPEGAFRDSSGNLVEEMHSYYDADAGSYMGLYWRVETKKFEAVSVTPEEEIVPASAFDIVVTFAESVSTNVLKDGDITLTYDDGVNPLYNDVLASEVTTSGNDLIIAMSTVPIAGMTITLNIPEVVLSIGYGNPNAEFTATWLIRQMVLSDLVGNYTVDAQSYGDPELWDEIWTVTVDTIPGDTAHLSITIDAGYGGGLPFLAAVDTDSMKITIPAGTIVGDLYGYGTTVLVESDFLSIDETADLVGAIIDYNSFTIDLMGMYLPDYEFDDGSVGGIYDAFNTTWTKTATKAAISTGSINPAKAARFK